MASGKVYIVSSPSLAQAVFRSKTLSFAPFAVEFVSRLDGLSAHAKQVYAQGLHTTVMDLFAVTMSGLPRKRMAANALQEVTNLLPNRASEVNYAQDGKAVRVPVNDLWIWIRDIMTMATTSAMLGKTHNPWAKDPSLVEAYW